MLCIDLFEGDEWPTQLLDGTTTVQAVNDGGTALNGLSISKTTFGHQRADERLGRNKRPSCLLQTHRP